MHVALGGARYCSLFSLKCVFLNSCIHYFKPFLPHRPTPPPFVFRRRSILKGWEAFTDAVVQAVSESSENVVFLLWGAKAQKKGKAIDRTKVRAPHKTLARVCVY